MILLAIMNLTEILIYDKISITIREMFGILHDEDGNNVGMWSNNFIGQLLSCYKCTSVWVSLFFALLYLTHKPIYHFTVSWLGLSWLASKINQFDLQ